MPDIKKIKLSQPKTVSSIHRSLACKPKSFDMETPSKLRAAKTREFTGIKREVIKLILSSFRKLP